MSWTSGTESPVLVDAPGGARRSSGWLTGIDAARGLALIGLISVQVLLGGDRGTQASGWAPLLVPGAVTALFALLAGVELALGCGGRFPHEGRWLAADRVGMAVRAALIAGVGLGAGALMPEGAAAGDVLLYYGVLCVLAIPFLHLSARALFVCAALCWIGGPLLVQALVALLPAATSSTLTVAHVVDEPAGTVSRLLVAGCYPALPYLTCLLAGLGLGRMRLRDPGVQVLLPAVGAGLVVVAVAACRVGILAFGGSAPGPAAGGSGEDGRGGVPVGSLDPLPTGWWPAPASWHVDPLWATAAQLGAGLLVLGGCLLLSRRRGAWLLPLSAMGAMALTLYTAHLAALALMFHAGLPYVWGVLLLGVVALAALLRQRALGQGPLEQVVSAGVSTTRRAVLHRSHRR